jgi:hypothetical protein
MINTLLVLVFFSVYTFDVSITTFPRQGQCIDVHSCKERLSSGEMLALLLAGLTDV